MRRFERYLAIPFKDKGRGFDGCDCWGLVWLIYKTELGIDLPAFSEVSAAELLAIARCSVSAVEGADPWRFVPRGEQRLFDVAVMRGPPVFDGKRYVRAPIHFGVMIDVARLLHIVGGANAVCVPLFDHPMASPLMPARPPFGFYRHRDLPQSA